MTKSNLFKTILFAAIALLLAGGAQALNLGADGGNVAWNVDTANDGVQLSVSGPDGFVWEQTYDAGEAPSFSIFDKNGYAFPEGQYNWELTIVPAIDDATRKAMHAARESGDQVALAQLEKSLGQRTHSGTFRIEGGSVMLPTEMPEGLERLEKAQATDQALEKDFVINDDLIVTLSACIGNDCVNGEVFSFDTIRLKENNLRIKFEDTSVGSFPTSDWEIEANSSANGGPSYFRVDDVTAGTSPFTIEANAPSHTLYVDSTKRIGIGTSTPVVELHVKHGDSPTLRLEQDGSSGFQPQTWDIAGNEANFFVRDATNGSTLPFRIQPGAPSSSIYIATGGDVGIGTASPSKKLHVVDDNASDLLLLESDEAATKLELKNDGAATALTWALALDQATDTFRMSKQGSGTVEFSLDNSGDLLIAGTLTENSSVHVKENFEPVDPLRMLEQVVGLPISEWNYKADDPSVRHIGPMAQDFFATFGVGGTDKGIAPRNLSAVALAAIQGLYQELQDKQVKVNDLETRLAELESLVLSGATP